MLPMLIQDFEPVKSVLVVDENLMARKLLRQRVEQLGYAVYEADSRSDALVFCAHQTPDLILLDLDEGLACGPTALEMFLHSVSIPDVPVVALTNATDIADVEALIRAGAADLIAKPAQPNALVQAIGELIGSPLLSGERDLDWPPSSFGSDVLLDLERLEQLVVEFGSDATQDLIGRFRSRAAELGEEILNSWDDAVTCRSAALNLKAAAKVLGLQQLASACREIAQAAKEDNPFELRFMAEGVQFRLDQALKGLAAMAPAQDIAA